MAVMTPPRSSHIFWSSLLALILTLTGVTAMAETPLDREARAIEAMLIAPCCYSQQVSVHQSAAADEVRREVRTMLGAGKTRQEILDHYVGRYGARILATPPAEGINLVLYITPVAVLIGSIGLVAFVIRRFSAAVPAGVEPPGDRRRPTGTPLVDVEARLEDELRELD
jgi:cytochrome c-type biogenesis protein CcmH